jgi:chemotaxis protein methyltransferase CheR
VEPSPEELARFHALVLETFGFNLEAGREGTLKRALKQRMTLLGLDSCEAYHAALVASRPEADRLAELLTVHETYFFREPEQLNLAIDHLLPEIMEERPGPYRLLSVGCSSGEEAYSLAILLQERHGLQSRQLFSIAGVDLDDGVIASARRGVFGRHSFRGVAPEVMARHFEPIAAHTFKVRSALGPAVAFEALNLLGSPYPEIMHRPDLIFYRNVSIYFQETVQRLIFQRLAELLPIGGYLIVGATETLHHNLGILALVERNGLFVFRKQADFSLGDRRAARRESGVPSRELRMAASGPPGPGSDGARRVAVQRHAPVMALPRDPRRLFDDALALARSSQGQEALGVLDGLLRQEAGFTKAHSLKAAILLGQGRFEESRQACLAALALDPLILEACLMLGVIARNEGDNLVAQQRFREAIYLDGACWMAHFYLAEILLQNGQSRRARSGFEAVLRLLGDGGQREQWLFPLVYKTEPFIAISRHKLALLQKNG